MKRYLKDCSKGKTSERREEEIKNTTGEEVERKILGYLPFSPFSFKTEKANEASVQPK